MRIDNRRRHETLNDRINEKSYLKSAYVGKALNDYNDSTLVKAIDKPIVVDGRAVRWPEGQALIDFQLYNRRLRNYSKSDLRRMNINKAITNEANKLQNDYNYRNGDYINFEKPMISSNADKHSDSRKRGPVYKYDLTVGESNDVEDIMKGVDVLKKIRELTNKYL